MTFFAIINESGELQIKNRAKVLEGIKAMKPGNVRIKVDYVEQRSLSTNRYYWGVVIWLVRKRLEELGNLVTDEMTHDFLKDKFNSKMIVGPGGEVVGEVGQSSASLTEDEFSLYVSKIREWAGQVLDIYIPYKGERLELDF